MRYQILSIKSSDFLARPCSFSPVYLPGRGTLLFLYAVLAVIEIKLFVYSWWQLCAEKFHHL